MSASASTEVIVCSGSTIAPTTNPQVSALPTLLINKAIASFDSYITILFACVAVNSEPVTINVPTPVEFDPAPNPFEPVDHDENVPAFFMDATIKSPAAIEALSVQSAIFAVLVLAPTTFTPAMTID